MTNEQLKYEARKQRALERLQTNNPRCGMCGMNDWRCMERHHPVDRGRDDLTVLLCRNCHRQVSDDQKSHPALNPDADPMLDAIGHFLLGLADMLRRIVERLTAFGLELIERAALAAPGGEK